MLTVVAGSILFCVSSYIGICIKKHYKYKMTVLKEIKDFCDFAMNKITLLKEPVIQILLEYAGTCTKEGQKIFVSYAKFRENEDNTLPQCAFLSSLENKTVADFMTNMGKSDMNNEVIKINSFRQNVSALYEKSVTLYEKKGVTYYKLSVLLGIAMMLLVC